MKCCSRGLVSRAPVRANLWFHGKHIAARAAYSERRMLRGGRLNASVVESNVRAPQGGSIAANVSAERMRVLNFSSGSILKLFLQHVEIRNFQMRWRDTAWAMFPCTHLGAPPSLQIVKQLLLHSRAGLLIRNIRLSVWSTFQCTTPLPSSS